MVRANNRSLSLLLGAAPIAPRAKLTPLSGSGQGCGTIDSQHSTARHDAAGADPLSVPAPAPANEQGTTPNQTCSEDASATQIAASAIRAAASASDSAAFLPARQQLQELSLRQMQPPEPVVPAAQNHLQQAQQQRNAGYYHCHSTAGWMVITKQWLGRMLRAVLMVLCSWASAMSHCAPHWSSATTPPSTLAARWKACRVRLLALLDAPATSWVLVGLTLFVIFQEDVKYALLPPTADLGLEAVTLAILLLFSLEIGDHPAKRCILQYLCSHIPVVQHPTLQPHVSPNLPHLLFVAPPPSAVVYCAPGILSVILLLA